MLGSMMEKREKWLVETTFVPAKENSRGNEFGLIF
jgi:hypothetical protein